MGAKEGQKMLTLWIDAEERDAFQTLCKTKGISVSSALRTWIQSAIREQTISIAAADPETAPEAKSAPDAFADLIGRLTALETRDYQGLEQRVNHLEKAIQHRKQKGT
tara:strand:+ start:6979 stop:7302 length:324 start_codon:yes stop_codon:yes gene_type:complete